MPACNDPRRAAAAKSPREAVASPEGNTVEGLEMLQRVVDTTTDLIDHTSSAQLGNQTLCTDWTVKDLINHMVTGATMFAISVEEGSIPDAVLGPLMSGDNVGDDPQGTWNAASKRALAAFRLPGAMEKTVALPFGEMPAPVALNIANFDVATHAVDLARATGQHVKDTQLLEDALVLAHQMLAPEMRAMGIFGDEQPCAESAPVDDRLLAFTGRKV
jgi:uncharacterized protein (TIGR03086 family)